VSLLLVRVSVAQVFAQILIALGLIGTSIAQIIACASDVYYINTSLDKRSVHAASAAAANRQPDWPGQPVSRSATRASTIRCKERLTQTARKPEAPWPHALVAPCTL
jgi:hypothetical protein